MSYEKISVSQGVEQVREKEGAESEIIQEMITNLPQQIARLHDEVTGVDGGSGGQEAPYSLEDIGNMLRGLQLIFETQLKAKAFELFDEAAEYYPEWEKSKSTSGEVLLQLIAGPELGVLSDMRKRFYQEWKTQRSRS